jgi:hypothetical protein
MYGIGKTTLLRVLEKGRTLSLMGEVVEEAEIVEEAAEFAKACYGAADAASMSEARYRVWLRKTGQKKVTAAPCLKSLPPINRRRLHSERQKSPISKRPYGSWPFILIRPLKQDGTHATSGRRGMKAERLLHQGTSMGRASNRHRRKYWK